MHPLDNPEKYAGTPWEAAAGMVREERTIYQLHTVVIKGVADVVFFPSDTPRMVVAASTAQSMRDTITKIECGTLTITGPETRVNVAAGNVVISNGGRISVTGSGNIVAGGNMHFYGPVGQVAVGDLVVVEPSRIIVGISMPGAPSIRVSGSGNAYLYDVDQDSLELRVSGAGDIRARGRVDTLRARVSGAGDIKAKRLHAANAELEVSGAGDISVFASQSVAADISGVGTAKVWGNPIKRNCDVSGVGEVKFRT